MRKQQNSFQLPCSIFMHTLYDPVLFYFINIYKKNNTPIFTFTRNKKKSNVLGPKTQIYVLMIENFVVKLAVDYILIFYVKQKVEKQILI